MIELVPFTEADVDRVIAWIDSVEALELWTAWSFGYPLTREHLLAHLRDSTARGDRQIFKAVETDSGDVVGHIELAWIAPHNHILRIGRVLLAPQCRGRGLGVEMMRAAMAMAFEQHGAHRVELGVFDVNPRAIACYEKAGFRQEGIRRESFPASGGACWSEITMSILADEWAQSRG
ncbi:MAG TPA: GNAT family protein [Thermoanaerobaculia bacterium]|nr:GNAT family protein [Thermoanaerobaculia bacterium]